MREWTAVAVEELAMEMAVKAAAMKERQDGGGTGGAGGGDAWRRPAG